MKVDLALCGFCEDGEKGAELLIVGAVRGEFGFGDDFPSDRESVPAGSCIEFFEAIADGAPDRHGRRAMTHSTEDQ